MRKTIAALVLAGVMVLASAAPANAWYVKNPGTACKSGTYSTLQHRWYNWFETRSICYKPGEYTPLFY